MNNKVGLCLWTFGDSLPFSQKVSIAKQIGVDGVEIEGDLKMDPLLTRNILDQENLEIFSVTPMNKNIVDKNLSNRLKNINYFLELIDWAHLAGIQRICIHGEVGLIASDDYERDWSYLVESTKKITKYARKHEIEVVFEVLNRYENYQVINHEQGLRLIEEVDEPNLKLLLDSYHMNIEEKRPEEALENSMKVLGVYHIADSNREGIGEGHSNLLEQLKKLKKNNYRGPIIMEMNAPGPNPFTANKGNDFIEQLTEFYTKSMKIIKEI